MLENTNKNYSKFLKYLNTQNQALLIFYSFFYFYLLA